MTESELAASWHKYAVVINNKLHNLDDIFAICYGPEPSGHGLVFDKGGEQPGVMYFLTVEGDTLVSIDPENTDRRRKLGKLIKRKL